PRAEPAAELAFEARAQRGDTGFWEASDALFADQDRLEDADLAALAKRLGLNANAMNAVAKHKHKDVIERDQDLADDFAATSTPQFFINGRRIIGSQPLDKFKSIIEEEIAKAEAMVKAGTKPEKVYEAILATAKAPDTPPKITVHLPRRDAPSLGL